MKGNLLGMIWEELGMIISFSVSPSCWSSTWNPLYLSVLVALQQETRVQFVLILSSLSSHSVLLGPPSNTLAVWSKPDFQTRSLVAPAHVLYATNFYD